MGYALFSQASKWLINAYGESDPVAVADAVNKIRRTFYSWYAQIDIAPLVEECFELQTFCVDCDRCDDTYAGLTLPRGYGTPEAMWYNARPVQLFDRWRQWHTGITPSCECGLKSFAMGQDFPTERDIRPKHPAYIVATVQNPADAGKRVVIRGELIGGQESEETLILSDTSVRTNLPYRSINRAGGIAKDETVAPVVLSEESGRVLSIYAADEVLPAYTRLKITGVSDGCQHINIRANRSFVRVGDAFDVVETDNQMVWESMGKFLRLNEKTIRNAEEMKSEQAFALQAQSLLMGDKSREVGKSTQSQVEIRSPRGLGRSRLIGRGRRW